MSLGSCTAHGNIFSDFYTIAVNVEYVNIIEKLRIFVVNRRGNVTN